MTRSFPAAGSVKSRPRAAHRSRALRDSPAASDVNGERGAKAPCYLFSRHHHGRRTRRRPRTGTRRAYAERAAPRAARPDRDDQVRGDAARPVRPPPPRGGLQPLRSAAGDRGRRHHGQRQAEPSRATRSARTTGCTSRCRSRRTTSRFPRTSRSTSSTRTSSWRSSTSRPTWSSTRRRGTGPGTLVNALQFHFREHLSTRQRRLPGRHRPPARQGHQRRHPRSPRTTQTHRDLAMQFETRKVFKEYVALTAGRTGPRHATTSRAASKHAPARPA